MDFVKTSKFLGGVLLFCGTWLVSCSQGEPPVRFLIGVSQANLSEPWRISMTDEIQRQASLHPELRVIVADASDSLGKQIEDVETFEGLGVDLMIISPLESEALTPTVARVYQKMPVIVVNRSVANDDYTLFIGPDNARIGQEAGRFVAKTLQNSGGEVLEILGRSASPPTLERAEGFRREIAKNPLIRLQSPVLANWLRDAAEDSVADRLGVDGPAKVVFAHNDAMAYGAWLAAEKLGVAKKITFLGVDGLPGPRGGLELLRSGILDGTFLSPSGGREAVEFALSLLRHEGEQPKEVILGTKFLTRADLVTAPLVRRTASPPAIAFLPSSGDDAWRRGLRESVEKSLGSGGWSLTVLSEADGSVPSGFDAVVVDAADQGPRDRQRRQAVEALARAHGQPLFRVGPQPPQGDDSGWVLALGPDPTKEGLRVARWFVEKGVHRVLEVTGSRQEAGTEERSEGLAHGLAERGGIQVEERLETDGSRQGARDAVARVVAEGLAFDAVFAHSDELALGAADALGPRGSDRVIVALGGGTEALRALKEGTLKAVIRSPNDLGPLLRGDLVRYWENPGVSRRLVTSHDVITD